MDWKLIRIDHAYRPPQQSFSMHETRQDALEVVRDHPWAARIKNRIEGPGVRLEHDEIARWCEQHPAAIEPVQPVAKSESEANQVGKLEAAFEAGEEEVDDGTLFAGLAAVK